MRRLAARLAAFAAIALPALAYATLSGFARRPLSPGEAWGFGAAVLRATPAHLGGASPMQTLRLGGRAFGSPLAAFTLGGRSGSYVIPLPPRTVHAPSPRSPHRFVTFASGADLHAYLHSTLPSAGWRYGEQFGSVHALRRGTMLLSVGSSFYVGTRVRELRFRSAAPSAERNAKRARHRPRPLHQIRKKSGPHAESAELAEAVITFNSADSADSA